MAPDVRLEAVPLVPVFEPQTGDLIGRYRLLEAVGAGGMGHVWLAEVAISAAIQRRVALKFLRGTGIVDQLFADEVAVLAQLHHPNVVQLLDSGTHEGTAWYAMEWIPGQSVLSMMKPGLELQAIPLPVALTVALDVCDGLGAAHEATSPDGRHLGIVHRDVAPANVVITSSGLCKLIDFGIAVSSLRKAEATHAGLIRGRVAYLSPERMLHDPVDGRADQWSLGVMLYEMVAGKRLFETGDATQTMQLILAGTPDLSALPAPLSEVVSRMLQLSPQQRFATMAHARQALETAAEMLKVSVGHGLVRRFVAGAAERATDLYTPSLPLEVPVDAPAVTPNKGLIAAVVIVGLAAVAVLAALLLMPSTPRRAPSEPAPEATEPIVAVRTPPPAARVLAPEVPDASVSVAIEAPGAPPALVRDAGRLPDAKVPGRGKKRRPDASTIDELEPLD